MELVKETNGWKLYKGKKLNDYTIELPNGLKNYYPHYRKEEFDIAVERGWIWVNVEYLVGRIVNSKIEIEKRKKGIQSNKYDLFLKAHCISSEQVHKKLKPILKKAKEKFLNCNSKFQKLKEELDFDLDYVMEGDTYGIYDDYLCINFSIDDVHCHFEIR